MKREEIVQKLKGYRDFLKEHFGVKEIGIFGSVAKDNFTESSDIDIYVEFEMDKVSLNSYLEFIEFLEKGLGRKVDVITKGGLQTIRIPEVRKEIQESILYV
jgi:predicted nucleotidyltransferase